MILECDIITASVGITGEVVELFAFFMFVEFMFNKIDYLRILIEHNKRGLDLLVFYYGRLAPKLAKKRHTTTEEKPRKEE